MKLGVLAKVLGLVISKSSQGAVQADGKAPLTVIGEVKHFEFVKGAHTLTCEALVVEEDIGDVVGGEPFLEINDIYVRPLATLFNVYVAERNRILPSAPAGFQWGKTNSRTWAVQPYRR